MAFVVAALWRAKKGEEEAVQRAIKIMIPLSRQEPACLAYQAQRSTSDPQLFFLYEQYTNEAGYEAHMATPHFEKYVRGDAIPRLESRERSFYETFG